MAVFDRIDIQPPNLPSFHSSSSSSFTTMAPHPHLGWINPVINHDFADPGVFYDKASNKWYAYGTNSNGKNIQCSYTSDFCSWTHHDQDMLPGPFPPWTGQPGFFWAPEVIPAPQGRPGYLMYTSCQDKSTGKQCIGVAYTQGGPLGPFSFISYGPIVSRGETGGSLSAMHQVREELPPADLSLPLPHRLTGSSTFRRSTNWKEVPRLQERL